MSDLLFELNDTQLAVRDLARDFARKRIAPVARDLDRAGVFPADVLHELAQLGLMGVNVPEALGGAQAGVVAYSLAMQEIAEASASVAVAMAVTNMVGELIVKFGTPAQQRAWVPELTSGRFAAGSFALSEPQAGSDAAAMRTTARRTANGWVLDGAKQWITSGDRAGVLVVWARTGLPGPGGLSAFLVPGGARGMSVGRHEEKMGLRASTTVALTFEGCELPSDALLGGEGDGFKLAMTALDGGRIGIASQACGIARGALAASVRYAHERKAFGQEIGGFQAIRWMLADMATQLDAATLLTLRAAALKEQGASYTREGSMAKLFASEMANRVVDKAVQIHGGYGYTDEFPVERAFRDARVTTIYEGTSEIQRLVIARSILKD